VMTPGPNMGRAIAINGVQFLIGRDQECNLRPASPAISKQHCGLYIRDGQVYIRDLGSTNGTQLNGKNVEGEVLVPTGAILKAGPLEFRVEIAGKRLSDGTPLPQQLRDQDKTVTKSDPTKVAVKPASVKPSPAVGQPPAERPSKSVAPAPKPAPVHAESDGDAAAALLLGLDDPLPGESSTPQIPEGSTIMDLPLVTEEQIREAEEKKKKKSISGAEMSAAANDILRKYIRRTGN